MQPVKELIPSENMTPCHLVIYCSQLADLWYCYLQCQYYEEHNK
jgi:hypothetical protein